LVVIYFGNGYITLQYVDQLNTIEIYVIISRILSRIVIQSVVSGLFFVTI